MKHFHNNHPKFIQVFGMFLFSVLLSLCAVFSRNEKASNPDEALIEDLTPDIISPGLAFVNVTVCRTDGDDPSELTDTLYHYNSGWYEDFFCRYDDAEMAQYSHMEFDDEGRAAYSLHFDESPHVTYCEEEVIERNDATHTARRYYYKSEKLPYEDRFYITNRYLFDFYDLYFTEDGRVLSQLEYCRNDLGWGDCFILSGGYWADYKEDRLSFEIDYNVWDETSVVWYNFRYYEYDENGTLTNIIYDGDLGDDQDLTVLSFEELDAAGHEWALYTYRIRQDYTFHCHNGSTISIYPRVWESFDREHPVLQKTAADGTVELALYRETMPHLDEETDAAFCSTLSPWVVTEASPNHFYTIQPGDCLSSISEEYYGDSRYADLIYQENCGRIYMRSPDLILPGKRIYLPFLVPE